jgi:glutathione S-transferase
MKPTLYIGNKNYSSWSLRAWFLLSEAEIEFEEVRLPLDTPEFPKRIREVSPAGRVPVLHLEGRPVWDTLAIAETVAERWPDRGLWPSDAAARAHARSVSAEMHSGFSALREAMPMNCRAMGRRVTMSDATAADVERIQAIWADCAERYGGQEGDTGWLFGRFSIADAMYAPVVFRFRTYGVNVAESASAYPGRVLKSRPIQNWLRAAESETEVLENDEAGQ